MNALHKMPQRYLAPAATWETPHKTELIIKKSRFFAQTCRCGNVRSAREFIARIKAANPTATHNCWAFSVQPPGQSGMAGSSDDGEPHGTAGRPMLQVILASPFGEICMVVSRWFGGVKLGAGGLVRAYQQAARENLQTLPGIEQVPCESLKISLDYGHIDAVKNFIEDMGAAIESEDYGEKVNMFIKTPLDKYESFAQGLLGLTAGAAIIEKLPPLEYR